MRKKILIIVVTTVTNTEITGKHFSQTLSRASKKRQLSLEDDLVDFPRRNPGKLLDSVYRLRKRRALSGYRKLLKYPETADFLFIFFYYLPFFYFCSLLFEVNIFIIVLVHRID